MNKKSIILMIIIILVLGILSAAANLFFWRRINFQNHQFQQQLQQQLQQQQTQQQSLMQNLNKQIQQQSLSLTVTQNKLNQLTNLINQGSRQQGLNEAAYLIDLANIYLELNKDVNNAIKLLNLAQYHLRTLTDPRLLPLERSLASDLNRLKEIAVVDSANLVLELQTLGESISRLDFTPAHISKNPSSTLEESASSTPQSWYEKALHSLLNKLKGVLIIHYKQPGHVAILPPDQRELVRENLEFALKQAQWAVLQQQEKLYQQNLEQIQKWVTDSYLDNAAQSQVLARLKNLININISPSIPSLKNTLETLKQAQIEQSTPITPTIPEHTPEAPSSPPSPPPKVTHGIEI